MSGQRLRRSQRAFAKAMLSLGIEDQSDKELFNIFQPESEIHISSARKRPTKGETFVSLIIRSLEANEHSHSVKAERRAQKLLRMHISRKQWESYFISGAFVEYSSFGNYYIFRKGFPTILCKVITKKGNKKLIIPQYALCGHTGLYTMGTFSGGLCPSDDVLMHLTSMRVNEEEYINSCNKHKLSQPQSGC